MTQLSSSAKNCCNKELDAFFKLRVTCWILLKRRLKMNRDMAQRICQFMVQPIHDFNNNDEFSRHGSCARINASMDGFFSYTSKHLKGVSDVEVDIAPLTGVSYRTFTSFLRAFNFETVIVHWELAIISTESELLFDIIKEHTSLYILVYAFTGVSQNRCEVRGTKMIRIMDENEI